MCVCICVCLRAWQDFKPGKTSRESHASLLKGLTGTTGASLVAQRLKRLPPKQETQV